jgi:DNA polymerase
MDSNNIREEYLNVVATVREYVAEQLKFGILEAEATDAEEPKFAGLDLSALNADAQSCTKCGLHEGRNSVVFGVGNQNADLMFVGEAPGADEDKQGEPFVGRAGKLLTDIITAMKFTRNDVYIANVLKCRPPGNRNPAPNEVETCSPYLLRQIALIQPKVIVALGSFAAKMLLDTNIGISALRGKFHEFALAKQAESSVVIMPTYHPAYLLRSPNAKRDVWEDMKQVITFLDEN